MSLMPNLPLNRQKLVILSSIMDDISFQTDISSIICLLVTGFGSGTSPRKCSCLYHRLSSFRGQKKPVNPNYTHCFHLDRLFIYILDHTWVGLPIVTYHTSFSHQRHGYFRRCIEHPLAWLYLQSGFLFLCFVEDHRLRGKAEAIFRR